MHLGHLVTTGLFVCLSELLLSKCEGGHNLSAEVWKNGLGMFPGVFRKGGNQNSDMTPFPMHLCVLLHQVSCFGPGSVIKDKGTAHSALSMLC